MSVLVENDRALRLWRRLGYQPRGEVVRKRIWAEVLPAPQMAAEIVIRRLGDPAAEWSSLWPLVNIQETELQDRPGNSVPNTEAAQRLRFQAFAEKKRLTLVAEVRGQICGMATVRLAKNPWILEERVGIFEDFYCTSGQRAPELRSLLGREIESWLARKRANWAQRATTLKDAELWLEDGFQRHLVTLRKDL